METTSTIDPLIVWPNAFFLKTLDGKYLKGNSGMINCFEWDPNWSDLDRTFKVTELKDNFVGIINTFETQEERYGHREDTYNAIYCGKATIRDNSYKFFCVNLGDNKIAIKCDNGCFWTIAKNNYIQAISPNIDEKTTFIVEAVPVLGVVTK
jgi:hypothetical protein